MPDYLWLLIILALAIYFFKVVRLGINLQRDPFLLVGVVACVLLVLLLDAYKHQGVNQLEHVDVCTPPASAWPRAPQPTANLAGCPGYNAPVPDPAHNIPETTVPDIQPTPSWAADPRR